MSKFIILGGLILLALFVFLRDTPLRVANFPGRDCAVFESWLTSKTKTQPEIERILPPPEHPNFFFDTATVGDGGGSEWSAVAKDILGWAGWTSSRMQYASFRPYTYNQLIQSPSLQTGAFLIVIPGPSEVKLSRRNFEEPWVTASPESFAHALPLKALQTLARALESRLGAKKFETANVSTGGKSTRGDGGDINLNNNTKRADSNNRKLHRFHIKVTSSPYLFPLCRGRGGACAIWEGSTGRVILDADVARRMSTSPTIARLLDKFTIAFASMLQNGANSVVKEEDLIKEGSFDDSSNTATTTATTAANISFSSRLPRYIKRNEEDERGNEKETNEEKYSSSVESIGSFFAKAATAAITSILLSSGSGGGGGGNGVGRQPLWWCITCPIVLGMLAPFVINFGLTAAAEQLCAALQLPAEECSDLWWAAFALAMVLSLGSAVPIVYVCRLPDCIKRALN